METHCPHHRRQRNDTRGRHAPPIRGTFPNGGTMSHPRETTGRQMERSLPTIPPGVKSQKLAGTCPCFVLFIWGLGSGSCFGFHVCLPGGTGYPSVLFNFFVCLSLVCTGVRALSLLFFLIVAGVMLGSQSCCFARLFARWWGAVFEWSLESRMLQVFWFCCSVCLVVGQNFPFCFPIVSMVGLCWFPFFRQ